MTSLPPQAKRAPPFIVGEVLPTGSTSNVQGSFAVFLAAADGAWRDVVALGADPPGGGKGFAYVDSFQDEKAVT